MFNGGVIVIMVFVVILRVVMVEVMVGQANVNVYVFKKFVLCKYLVFQGTD
jgi:hypothetical protein